MIEDQSHLFWTFVLVLFWLALFIVIGGGVAWWLYSKRRKERRKAAGRAARQLARDWRDGKLPSQPPPFRDSVGSPKSKRRGERRNTWRID